MTSGAGTGAASRPDRTIAWMRHGTALFTGALAHLSDEALGARSTLPGWTRRHVTAHVARNADALVKLLVWARTGTRMPMYREPGQRTADIAATANQRADALRADLFASVGRLEEALDSMPDRSWTAPVQSASGRTLAAAEVPWLRTREVYIHAVDLAASASFDDIPADVLEALFDDATKLLSTRDDVPYITIDAVNIRRRWTVGRPSTRQPEPTVLTANASALAAYVFGRPVSDEMCEASTRPPPRLPAWL
jgi:maleylpyruvate isomerase